MYYREIFTVISGCLCKLFKYSHICYISHGCVHKPKIALERRLISSQSKITLLILHDNHSSFRDMFRDDKEFRDVNHM